MNEQLHQIRICINPECGFRFPVIGSPFGKKAASCPKCGSDAELAFEPYKSFLIQEKQTAAHGPEVAAVLDNIRSALNVGAIFRTADGAGISRLYLCGITPTADNAKVMKTSLGAETSVPWEHRRNVLETSKELKAAGYQLWALEGGATAGNIFHNLEYIHPDQPIALIVGNEINGIDPAVVEICDHCVYIPMSGIKESLNVATAFGIAAYLLRYWNIPMRDGKTIS